MDITVGGVASMVALLLTAGLTAFNVFFKKKDETVDRTNNTEDRLIQLLQANVSALQMKVTDLEKKFMEAIQELAKIRSERDTMASILQGRDERSTEMIKASQIAMTNVASILTIVTGTEQRVVDIQKSIQNK